MQRDLTFCITAMFIVFFSINSLWFGKVIMCVEKWIPVPKFPELFYSVLRLAPSPSGTKENATSCRYLSAAFATSAIDRTGIIMRRSTASRICQLYVEILPGLSLSSMLRERPDFQALEMDIVTLPVDIIHGLQTLTSYGIKLHHTEICVHISYSNCSHDYYILTKY